VTNFSEQRKTTLWHSSSCEWIYTLDADEELSEELRASLLEWKQREANFNAYEHPRLTW